METNQSMSDRQGGREFYLPGMSVLSPVPGRIERYVTARLSDRTTLARDMVQSQPVRSFYLPAMAVLSNVPSRVERAITHGLRNHDTREKLGQLRQELREFYLPGTPRFAKPRQ